MIAKGRVRVACPVDVEGRETADHSAMIGLAARATYARQHFEDGEEFEIWTERKCLIVLAGPMDVPIQGTVYRLAPFDNHHVTISGGKIVEFEGRLIHG